MRKKVLLFVVAICMLAFLAPASIIKASYTKYTGTYKGTWRIYDMTCPSIYSNSNGTIKMVLKVKAKGKLTGKLKFGSENYYKINGKIKNKKIKVHYVGYDSYFDYNGTIKHHKIKMNASNNDSLTQRKCLSGWKEEIKAHKI